MNDHLNVSLAHIDPAIQAVLDDELDRERSYLEMIASENFAPISVLESAGSVLTNKYAEGYPGRRYYAGCGPVDVAEELAIERAKALFGAEYANVQPHSGATANAAVLSAIAQPGDTILGLRLDHGGHLTHGMPLNFSGKLYNVVTYGLDRNSSLIEMDQVRDLALAHRPKVIIAGWSAYPRYLDFAAFREIADEVGALLWVDMAHFAGLVAAGLHPNPVPVADIVSSTSHKTLGGPRGGFILSRDDTYAKSLNRNVFPGQQGGPLMHIIAAKATAFLLAGTEPFADRQRRTLEGARIVADRLLAPGCPSQRYRRTHRRDGRPPDPCGSSFFRNRWHHRRASPPRSRYHRQPEQHSFRSPPAALGDIGRSTRYPPCSRNPWIRNPRLHRDSRHRRPRPSAKTGHSHTTNPHQGTCREVPALPGTAAVTG